MPTDFAERPLPATIAPMLATLGEPFDSDQHLFEIKWDGIRAVAFVEDAGLVRAHGRRLRTLHPRYPELAALAPLPPGCALDGEMIVLSNGRPDFPAVLRREQATPQRAAALARTLPATFVVWDLLYEDFKPLLSRPCGERRERLRALLSQLRDPRIIMSEGVTGAGRAYFEQAVARELEGVVAKRLDSPYVPGQRTPYWCKFKRRQEIVCAIIGYVLDEEGRGDLRSVICAAEIEGELKCVGKVGSGLDERKRRDLLKRFAALKADRPAIPCPQQPNGLWLKPALFCKVAYLEVTPDGQLRAPAFVGLIEPGGR